MLEANIERWKEEIYQQGLQQGLEQGVKRGVKKGVQRGLQQGLQQGIHQGIQQGAKQAMLETARKLKARGVAIEEIIDITGLSKAEIEAL